MSDVDVMVEGGAGAAGDEGVSDPMVALAAELETTRATLASIRRERDVQRALFEARAHDLDIGAAMVEREAQGAPGKPVGELIAELKRRKPNLFVRAGGSAPAASPRSGAGTMSARPAGDDPRRVAAERAASSGDRNSLMAYLRLRRQTA